MEILFLVEDGDDIWKKLAEEAQQGGHEIVTANNIDTANK